MYDSEDTSKRDPVEYDPETGTYRVRFDWDRSTSPSTAVVRAIATVEGIDPTDVEPVHGAVDPEALDALLRPRFDGRPRSGGEVRFPLHDYEVTVRGEGEVSIRPVEESDDR